MQAAPYSTAAACGSTLRGRAGGRETYRSAGGLGRRGSGLRGHTSPSVCAWPQATHELKTIALV